VLLASVDEISRPQLKIATLALSAVALGVTLVESWRLPSVILVRHLQTLLDVVLLFISIVCRYSPRVNGSALFWFSGSLPSLLISTVSNGLPASPAIEST
jgi:hypothetical protein